MAKSEAEQLRAELQAIKLAHAQKEQQWLQEKEQYVQQVYELQHIISDLKAKLSKSKK